MPFPNPVLELKSVDYISRYCHFSIAKEKSQYFGKIQKFEYKLGLSVVPLTKSRNSQITLTPILN
jgi:hypothetical protein